MILEVMFWITLFCLAIHLMDMVVAIMGKTFSDRSGHAADIQMRDKLDFVMDN